MALRSLTLALILSSVAAGRPNLRRRQLDFDFESVAAEINGVDESSEALDPTSLDAVTEDTSVASILDVDEPIDVVDSVSLEVITTEDSREASLIDEALLDYADPEASIVEGTPIGDSMSFDENPVAQVSAETGDASSLESAPISSEEAPVDSDILDTIAPTEPSTADTPTDALPVPDDALANAVVTGDVADMADVVPTGDSADPQNVVSEAVTPEVTPEINFQGVAPLPDEGGRSYGGGGFLEVLGKESGAPLVTGSSTSKNKSKAKGSISGTGSSVGVGGGVSASQGSAGAWRFFMP